MHLWLLRKMEDGSLGVVNALLKDAVLNIRGKVSKGCQLPLALHACSVWEGRAGTHYFGLWSLRMHWRGKSLEAGLTLRRVCWLQHTPEGLRLSVECSQDSGQTLKGGQSLQGIQKSVHQEIGAGKYSCMSWAKSQPGYLNEEGLVIPRWDSLGKIASLMGDGVLFVFTCIIGIRTLISP